MRATSKPASIDRSQTSELVEIEQRGGHETRAAMTVPRESNAVVRTGAKLLNSTEA
jgi:hypothetical protein